MLRADDLLGHAAKHLKRMKSETQRALREGGVDSVHGLRVASRRLNEIVRLTEGWAPRRDVRNVRSQLRKLRRAFCDVRELDVLLAQVCQAGTMDVLNPNELAQLEGVLTGERARAMDRAHRSTNRLGLRGVFKSAQRLLAEAASGSKGSPKRASRRLAELLRDRAAALAEIDPAISEEVDLHDVRLRVKRLRYCAEVREQMTGRKLEHLLQAARTMQDLLGHWNDQLTAVRRITRIACRERHLSRQTGWSVHLLDYAARWGREAELDRQKIRARWPELGRFVRAIQPGEPARAQPPAKPSASPVGGGA